MRMKKKDVYEKWNEKGAGKDKVITCLWL